jgi:8-oxo-dGTP pyrophosphatase MutT (NUDIX family)
MVRLSGLYHAKSREEAERQNHTTENALIFIFALNGHVWIPRRSQDKNFHPGKLDITTAGGVMSGERHSVTARRELQEEAGLDIPDLRHVETFLNVFTGDHGETMSRVSNLYIGFSDDTPQPVDGEVEEFLLCEPVALRAHVMANEGDYVPSFLIELDKALAGYNALLT